LVGRAVLTFDTLAEGPEAGAFVIPGPGTKNGVTFPLPSQPVEGFSAVIDGRRPGWYVAMADNGFGSKMNSEDFLIRAYRVRPEFKTADGGSGTVLVGSFISFRDPRGLIGFPIVNEDTRRRLLTGGDIDPESLQRGRHGDLWVGDEFGPWIPALRPSREVARGAVRHAWWDHVAQQPVPQRPAGNAPHSRGLEAMAITPNRKYLYPALEGATLADPDQSRRLVFEFSNLPNSGRNPALPDDNEFSRRRAGVEVSRLIRGSSRTGHQPGPACLMSRWRPG
jgi:glycerophosphoryl diester phosphodiesterase